jgi:hypothetical protein
LLIDKRLLQATEMIWLTKTLDGGDNFALNRPNGDVA